jgi:glyoxylase-like metal-dependent hydrolase (beta-lactamase superfamily II)
MEKTAIPSIYPPTGTYEFSSIHVDLSCATPNARIHYTLDGSSPTEESPVYHRENGLLRLKGSHGSRTQLTIRAYAEADGLLPSAKVAFPYQFCCFEKGHYRHTMLREPTQDTLGIIRIEDYDLDKMYLVIGSERAILIDGGWDSSGDLLVLCQELTGFALPIDLVIAHGHPDHIMQIHTFLNAGKKVYFPVADLDAASSFGVNLSLDQIVDIGEGDALELGNGSLRVFTIPGHTPGSIVLLDEATGDLFASDAFGSNRRYVPDSAWLQIEPTATAESVLRQLNTFLEKTNGKLRRIFTGHNDEVLDAEAYLRALQSALKKAVDSGPASLAPSLRSAAESFGSGSIISEGSWRLDPLWVAANLRFLYDRDRDSTPPKYVPGFDPNITTDLNT